MFVYALVVALFSASLSVAGSGEAQPPATPGDDASMKPLIRARLDDLAARAKDDLGAIPTNPYHFPMGLSTDRSMRFVASDNWTSGFYPGTLWYLHGHSGDPALGDAAREWTSFLEREQYNTHTHDIGFMIQCSYGTGMRVADNDDYRPVVIQAARSLASRYNDTVGCIRSWDWNEERWTYPVIIDNMMNLELLYEAAKLTGDTALSYVATRHAETTLANHFREDNSSYHVVDYWPETGRVRGQVTFQGLADSSAWARGQAWGLYGYAIAYRETGRRQFLEQAREIADFMFEHPRMPVDLIPYWDFDDPGIPNAPRDASAAAVAAAALVKLAELDAERAEHNLELVDRILLSLESPLYHTDRAPFLLDHSVGAMPLDHGVDRPINYADYYYVEALLERLATEA